MSNYDNTNRGVLFKNDRKQTENHPDYTGSINIDGTEKYLSAWVKDGKKGKFMSLSIGKEKVSQNNYTESQPSQDFSDDIPL